MRYTNEFKDQIVGEIEEVGNVSLVCKRHGITPSTVQNWLRKNKNKDKISEHKKTRELEKRIKDQEHEILVLRSLLKKTFPLWNNEKPLS
jgi:transposase-like protein